MSIDTTQDPNAFLMGSGGKSAKFANIGDKVDGTIIEQPEMVQQTEFGTNKPLFWDDGKPKMQLRVILATDLAEDGEDDGRRAVYLRGGSKREDTTQGAVARAVKAAGATGLAVGGRLQLAYIGAEPTSSGSPRKRYAAKYEQPTTPVGGEELDDIFD